MRQRLRQEPPQTDWKAVERGWCLGDKEFNEQLLAQMYGRPGGHYGPELREGDELHAQRLALEELRRRGWGQQELVRRRKGDPQKLRIAWRLLRESTMTLKWIAQRLKMGTWTHVSNCLVLKRRADEKCK